MGCCKIFIKMVEAGPLQPGFFFFFFFLWVPEDVGSQSSDLLTVDENCLFSALVQGRGSSGSFHGKGGRGF